MRTPSDAVESDQEQLDRQLSELLQELRVAMPGVQLLFGFLLAVPFNQRFAQVTTFQRDLYLVTLLCSAVASALFIAPTAYHRIMFRHRDKPQLIRSATRMTLAGLVSLALAMTGAVLLVTDFLFSDRTAAIVAAITLAVFGWLWFGIALSRRLTGKRSH
ncbi:MAG: hypothetical protein JWQ48_2991 [Conexibacter sp.]|jgi:VIT1/CCC1 family predicted Fe2+/Mn2+ transporter|nr:hypothetical protein [Conexibacter sp.]